MKRTCASTTKSFWSFITNLKQYSFICSLKDRGDLISDSVQKAEVLNDQFVFTQEDFTNMSSLDNDSYPSMPEVTVSTQGVQKFPSCSPTKLLVPMTSYDLPARVLREFAVEIAPALSCIFQRSLDTGILPEDWRRANISPVFKKGDRTKASNYRPVSLTSICSKVLEHILHSNISDHLDQYNVLCEEQHGFRSKHSCESQLVQTIHDLALALDNRKQTDVVIMDFSKAFDKVAPIDEVIFCRYSHH